MATWTIDPDHSCAAFAVRHMGLAHVRGQFTRMKGVIRFDPADKTQSAVDVEIEVASVTTGIIKRDEHLLTDDFFDQPNYPSILFRSRAIEFTPENRCTVSGELTIHGITREVAFEGEYAGPRRNPYGSEVTVGFSGTMVINREDFGIMWGSELLEGGGLVAGREIQIFLDVEADLAE